MVTRSYQNMVCYVRVNIKGCLISYVDFDWDAHHKSKWSIRFNKPFTAQLHYAKISSGFVLSKCLEKFSKHHSSSTCLLTAFFSSCLLYCMAMSQDEIRSTLGLKRLKANYQIHLHWQDNPTLLQNHLMNQSSHTRTDHACLYDNL